MLVDGGLNAIRREEKHSWLVDGGTASRPYCSKNGNLALSLMAGTMQRNYGAPAGTCNTYRVAVLYSAIWSRQRVPTEGVSLLTGQYKLELAHVEIDGLRDCHEVPAS